MTTAEFNAAIAKLPTMTRTELEEAWEVKFDLPKDTAYRVALCIALGDELTQRQRRIPKGAAK